MLIRVSLLFFYTLLFIISGKAQKNDFIWPMGSYGFSSLDMILKDSIEKTFWPFSLNFNADPMKIDYFPYRRFFFDATNGTYCKNDGNLFCYTNGMQVNGPDDITLLGGDTINYNNYWLRSVRQSTGEKLGLSHFQGNIMLPTVKLNRELIYVFNTIYDSLKRKTIGVWFSIIDVNCNDGKGCVEKKDQVLIETSLKDGELKACRHANGKDWWLIAVSEDNTTFFIFILDQNGVYLVHEQKIGKENIGLDEGNTTFSHKGDKYAVNDGRYWDSIGVISIFDFDRCSGLLSNPFFDTLVIPAASVGQGIAFSPDDRYLYVNNMNDLYQYDITDLEKPRKHLATYDGFYSGTTPGFRSTQFGFWGYGPDGRLYNVSGAASAKYMHVMDYPNEGGEAISFRQHAIKIPNNPWSIPNFPHYRLGPLDGSPCDTLGLDNHPIAKYRYEADSIDYLRLRFTDLSYFRPETWSWDFGDGSPKSNIQSPYHTFPQSGTYDVCLTVSNENSSNKVCRTITLGTSSSNDEAGSRADISLFPNPVHDYLLVTLGEYVPAYGQIMIYDITGRPVLTQRIYYGQNNVDMSGLPAGIYVWKVMDGKVEIKEGKVVKN